MTDGACRRRLAFDVVTDAADARHTRNSLLSYYVVCLNPLWGRTMNCY
jgi:hypothetical protein